MRAKRSDLATAADCDWSFTERPGLMEALAGRVSYFAGVWKVDPDDLTQEVCLWLAANPKVRHKPDALILDDVREVARQIGKKQYRRNDFEVGLEEDPDDGDA